ncbi:MAG: hypothetical protein ABR611_02845 [Chthoniobacterales bacterium]
MRVYEYLFYRLYRWASRWEWDTTPHVSAFIMLVVLTGVNIQTILAIVELRRPASILANLSKTEDALCLIAIGLPQYFLVLYRAKYKRIERQFASEPPSQARRLGIIVLTYVVLSLTLPIVVAIIRGSILGTL